MKIKCAGCNQRVIQFRNLFLNPHNTLCPNCAVRLKFKATKANRPLMLLWILFMIFMVIKIENGQINNILGYSFLTFVFLIIENISWNTEINKEPPPAQAKSIDKNLILKIAIISSAFLYSYLHYDLKISDELPYIRALQLFLIFGSSYLVYIASKRKKK